MSFTNPVEVKSSTRCWSRSYKWSGGTKVVTDANGNKKPELRAEIRSWNTNTNANDVLDPNMKMAVVGFTTGLAGFNGEQGDKVIRYYSNEVISTFEQPLTLYAAGAGGTKTIYKDQMYETFKNDKPQGCKYTVFVYFYNFDTKNIDRFEMSGSALGAWFDLDKENGILHKRWTKIMPGETQVNGSVTFIPPVLEYGDMFTQAEIDEIVSSPAYKDYEAFEKKVSGGQVERADGIDQTPDVYDGEQSQEYLDASTAAPNTTDLTGVPF